MHLSRRILIQLAVFAVIALIAGSVMFFGYVDVPGMLGFGRYNVAMELPQSAGLYPAGNVTYRGTKVGKVESVGLTDGGHVRVLLSLNSDVRIPSNLQAEVHSQSAIGEQYVALLPRDATSHPLKDGDVIPLAETSVPPPTDAVIDATNRGLQAIPHDDLKVAIDEAYTAVGGLGPELSRITRGSTKLAIDTRANLDSLIRLIEQSAPVLDSQAESGSHIREWAAHLADISGQLRNHDGAVAGLLTNASPALDQARTLVERVQPTLPVILANLVSIGRVGITYHDGLEQLLVLVPQNVALTGGIVVPNMYNKGHPGGQLDFNLNLNLPPPCSTGYLPASQRRAPSLVDTPDRVEGDLYCRIPQDSPFNVRGARNLPCETRPGKRAPTVKMCESDEQYQPLNEGWNWKGDPNTTITGQDVPQLPPGSPPQGTPPGTAPPPAAPAPLPPLAVAQYDPATGSYVGPDGNVYTQADLAQGAPTDKTWQTMLMPPNPN